MEFMIAQLTAIFVSAHQGKGKKPQLSDFMLSSLMEEKSYKAQSAKEQRAMLEFLFPPHKGK